MGEMGYFFIFMICLVNILIPIPRKCIDLCYSIALLTSITSESGTHCDLMTEYDITSCKGNILRITDPLCGQSISRKLIKKFDFFFHLRLNNMLNEHLSWRLFKTPCRAYDVSVMRQNLHSHRHNIVLLVPSDVFVKHQWPLLLTWFNFNPRMDK